MPQIIDDDGNQRELTSWEVEAIVNANKEHCASMGTVYQLDKAAQKKVIDDHLIQMLDISEDLAVQMVDAYPEWSPSGVHYTVGYRLGYLGKLYKCLQEHDSQSDWTPSAAHSLWAEILPGQSGTAIGEWVQPNSTNPYSKGDKVTWKGQTWESLVDNNVWEPGANGTANLWKVV